MGRSALSCAAPAARYSMTAMRPPFPSPGRPRWRRARAMITSSTSNENGASASSRVHGAQVAAAFVAGGDAVGVVALHVVVVQVRGSACRSGLQRTALDLPRRAALRGTRASFRGPREALAAHAARDRGAAAYRARKGMRRVAACLLEGAGRRTGRFLQLRAQRERGHEARPCARSSVMPSSTSSSANAPR